MGSPFCQIQQRIIARRRGYTDCMVGERERRPESSHLENTVVCDRSNVRATGVAVVAGYMLAILSSTMAAAATKKEVAQCRAIQQGVERLDCFKSLKLGRKTKTEHSAPARTEKTTKSKTYKTILSPTSDDPATTSSIDRLSFAPGQPLCVDRDALAAMLVAGVLTSNPAEAATLGCQAIPDDAKLELLERYPSVFPFMRMIRVKVTSPAQPDLTSGFTIEMGH